ncbi:MAG: hypothetical protein JSU05_12770 [Bacteroidetes bacterium]|nr:hypothetical protein [Bacteroidota bacterium]
MAAGLYKWLLMAGLFCWHPFHVSVTEINHNAKDKILEVSCKLFTDDFEKVLETKYKTEVDLVHPKDQAAMDKLVSDYLRNHLSLKVDGKAVTLSYVGFEHQEEAVYGYLEVDNITSVKKVEITNTILHDLFTDQVSIMHVIVNGNRKSTKLDYPASQATISF